MPLISRLIALVTDTLGPAATGSEAVAGDEPEERLAAAALLVHVARVDGSIADGERSALLRLLAERFQLAPDAADALVRRADRLDQEVDDVAELIERMGHAVDVRDRERLLAMAYRVASADAPLGEFEDDLVWRVGHLLGFDDARIEAVRGDAVQGSPIEPSRRG